MDETQTNNRSVYDKGIGDDLRQIGVVTKYELLKHIRSRRMVVFVGIAALLFILITALSFLFDGGLPTNKTAFMTQYVGMVDLLLVIGVSLFCASTIAAEFEERTALLMFPRPIKKTSFFVGKVLACYIICGGIIAIYYLACIITSLLNTGGLDMNVFGSLGMAMMFMFGVGGFALLMSSVFKRGAMAVIVTIASLLLVLQMVSTMLEFFDVEPVFSITYAAKDIGNFLSNNVTGVPELNWPALTEFLDSIGITVSEFFDMLGISIKVYYPTHLMAFSIMAVWAVVTTTISALLFRRKEF